MMRELRLCLMFIGIFAAGCFSQTLPGASLENQTSQTGTVDCTDPTLAATAACTTGQGQVQRNPTGQGYSPNVDRVPQLTTPPEQLPYRNIPLNPSQRRRVKTTPWPETEFEQMVADSAGRPLPLFGQSLFDQPPSTFAPIDVLQVPSDYVIGPEDELQIRIWGQLEANLRVIVDRSGRIYIPRAGEISVAGVHYGDLEQHLKSELSKTFRNFNLTVNIGRLRSIEVLVVGNARYPGTYTISSLSTLVNAVFASGGPTPQGSLRHIQVRRDAATITDFDFYDLLIQGDKSKDVHLQSGDVLYFPPVGPLAAVSGSVNTSAIYELKEKSTLSDLIEMAGGMSSLADTARITIERLVDHHTRKTLEFPFDGQSKGETLQDGDIVRVFSIIPSFEDTVTLRGNVANPGRYPWKPGMRIRDLIPNAEALLTRRYWLDRAGIGSGRETEYPLTPERLRNVRCLPRNASGNANNQAPGAAALGTGGTSATDLQSALDTYNNQLDSSNSLRPSTGTSNSPYVYCEETGTTPDSDLAANSDRKQLGAQDGSLMTDENASTQRTARNVTADLRRFAPEINWDYAIIQRVNPTDLTSKLVWMSPRKAILERDETSNLELQPGDIVTIFSQRDISLPQNERSRYMVVEGEVKRPGVYKLEANETLHSVLQRAGGLTSNAYVYGAQLLRESARIEQQRSLDELVRNMEAQVRQTSLSVASSMTGGDAQAFAQLEQGILEQLRGVRATGRVALPVRPSDNKAGDFPDMVLEDGDRLIIPHIPSTVSVVGSVYNPGSFIFDVHTSSGAYLDMAGKGKPQSDLRHAFVLRANGVVVAANNVNGVFTGAKFERLRMNPGDEIVVPYKLPTGAWVRGLRDWSQIASQLAITGAALAVIH